MINENTIQGTPEAWESGELGNDERFVQIADGIKQSAIDESIGLQMISIRLQKSLIDDLKMIAEVNGLGYQPLIRQILTRFATCELKQMAREQIRANQTQQQADHQPEDPKKIA